MPCQPVPVQIVPINRETISFSAYTWYTLPHRKIGGIASSLKESVTVGAPLAELCPWSLSPIATFSYIIVGCVQSHRECSWSNTSDAPVVFSVERAQLRYDQCGQV